MKATGIVRRIDELGRIVIPKEIRRTLRIRETDPMEIFTDKEGEIVLKKYSPLGELAECAKEYSESLARTTGNVVCISDREQIIAMSGTVKKELAPFFCLQSDCRTPHLTAQLRQSFYTHGIYLQLCSL